MQKKYETIGKMFIKIHNKPETIRHLKLSFDNYKQFNLNKCVAVMDKIILLNIDLKDLTSVGSNNEELGFRFKYNDYHKAINYFDNTVKHYTDDKDKMYSCMFELGYVNVRIKNYKQAGEIF
jgi:hypothetical protein